ncbi:hypothetical protein [Bradyrhizobium sp. AUGA SZCCT0431]|uniref:hypothetical protein n=1 Tax=Bradyrhizobium sp. AUGA SZCCT0431 TaxID=2807674 RepID=UPI001BA57F38|nr:hypothetical protein [Bradyrhizobium sp. AUGA SZCCT0431]MBR1146651.1 hypothetical protein [Bradyrhizobium sp. AUGA SZCCT0431]
MDYALAKELKDAGFPLTEVPIQQMGGPFHDIDGTLYFNPTLEELIEACGERFGLLKVAHNMQPTPKWIAMSVDGVTYRGGASPTEAVARLWFALNTV